MKNLYFLLLLLFAYSNCYGQVTIGSGAKPKQGSLLDLKEFESAESDPGGKTSTKGIMLPRVVLKDLNKLTMGENVVKDEPIGTWKSHEGLTVFNVHEDLSKKICRGVYVFNSSSWIKLGDPCPFFFNINCDAIEVSGIYEEFDPVGEEHYLTIHLTDIDESAKGEELHIYTESNSGITFELDTVFSGEANQTIKIPAYGMPMGSGTFHHDIYINNLDCTFIIEIGEIPNPSMECVDATVQGAYVKGKTVNGDQNYISLTLTNIPASAKGKSFYIYSNNVNGMEFEFEGEYSGESTQIVKVPAIGRPVSAGVFAYDLYINYAQCSFNIEVEPTISCDATKLFGKFIQNKGVNGDQDYVSLTLTNIPESLKGKPLHIYSNEVNGIKFELETTYNGSSTQTLKVPAFGTPTAYGDIPYTININSQTCEFNVHTFASGNINYTILDSDGIVKVPARWPIALGGREGRIIMYDEGRYYFDDIATGNISASEVRVAALANVKRVYNGKEHTISYVLKKPSITVNELKNGGEILLKVAEIRNMPLYRGVDSANLQTLLTPKNKLLTTEVIKSEILAGSKGDTYNPSSQTTSFAIGNYYTRSEGDVLTLSFHALSEFQKNMTSNTSNKETYSKKFTIREIKDGILDFSGDSNLTQLTLRRYFERKPTIGSVTNLDLSSVAKGDTEYASISREGTTTNADSNIARTDNVHHLGGTRNGYSSIIINYNNGFILKDNERFYFFYKESILVIGTIKVWKNMTLSQILNSPNIRFE